MDPRTPAELDALVAQAEGLVVSFTEASCSVGGAVQPKLETLLASRFPKLRLVVLQRDLVPELAAHLGVFVVPAVVVYFAGRESARFARAFSLEQIAEAIDRPYGLLFGGA